MANLIIELKTDPDELALLQRIADALEAKYGPCRVENTPEGLRVAPVEAPAEPEPDAPVDLVSDEESPVITEADLRQRVVKLCAAGYKDTVRTIITGYAASVSDVPADKYGEVWAKLDALEG